MMTTPQYGMSLRVLTLLVLGFFISIYVVAFHTHSNIPLLSNFKTTATKKWDDESRYAISSESKSVPSSNGLPAGQSAAEFEQMIHDMVEAKVAVLMAKELKKRQDITELNVPGLNIPVLSIPAAGTPQPQSATGTSTTPPATITDADAMKALNTFGKALAKMADPGTTGGNSLGNVSSIAPTGSTGIGGLLSGALSSLGGGISLPSLGDSSAALGQGLAQGTIDGLKLPKKVGVAPPTVPTGTLDSAAYNLGDSLAGTFTSQVDVTMSPEMMKMVLMNVAMSVVPAANGIGQGTAAGLGLNRPGTPPPAMLIDPNNPQPPAIAHDFSLALTQTFLGGIDTKALTASTPAQAAAMQQMILAALPGVGTGLGSGTAIGLGLSKASVNTSTAGPPTTIPQGAEQFSRQLSSSFLGSLDISKVIALQAAAAPASPAGPSMINKMIGPIAEGLGKGLGEGTAVGLGLKADSPMGPIDGTDMGLVTEAFSKNLVASFLANGTLMNLQPLLAAAGAGAPAFPPPVISKVTEGFGRGLVEGLETGLGMGNNSQDTFDDSVQGGAVGFAKGLSEASVNLVMGIIQGNPGLLAGLGMGNLTGIMMNGGAPGVPTLPGSPQSSPPATTPASPKSPAAEAPTPPKNPPAGSPAGAPKPAVSPNSSPSPASPPAPAGDASAPAPATAPVPAGGKFISGGGMLGGMPPAAGMVKRQNGGPPKPPPSSAMDPGGALQNGGPPKPSPSPAMDLGAALQNAGLGNLTNNLNITALTAQIVGNLNITQVNAQLQSQIDALTCTGVGGLISISQGLVDSGTIQLDPLAPGGNPVPGFGETKFTVYSNKNRFDFQPGLGKIITNGVESSRSIKLLALHSVLTSIAIFNIFPVVVMLGSAHDVTRMLGRPQILANAPRHQLLTQLLVYLPTLIAAVTTGVVVIGDGPHVNTPHKIIGYILFMLGLLWIATSRASSRGGSAKMVNIAVICLIFFVGIIALITGWNDLATISLCLTQKVSADLYIGLAILTTALFLSGMGVFGFVFLIGKWMSNPQTVGLSEKPMTAREARRISGPFLPEAIDYSGPPKNA